MTITLDGTNGISTPSVGIGTDTPSSPLTIYDATSSSLLVSGDSTTTIIAARASTDATSPNLNFRKYRGSSASPTAAVAEDGLGTSNYSAFDGTTLITAAQIQGSLESITGANSVAGYIRFFTRTTSTPLTERLRITSAGLVGIGTISPVGTLHIADVGTTGPAIFIEGASGTEGDITVLDGELMQMGHYNTSTATFTERFTIGASGQIGIAGGSYGTSGQVLTSAGPLAAPTWSAPASYTSLGSLLTSSGSSQTLSGLNLTDYTALVLVIDDVSSSSTLTNFSLRLISTSGVQISPNWSGVTSDGWFGITTIMLDSGVYSSVVAAQGTPPTGVNSTPYAGDCTISTSSTSVTVALSGTNSFSGGAVRFFGVK